MKKYVIFALSAIPSLALAQTTFPFLKNGIDRHAFSQCQTAVKTCPKTGPVRDQHCVQQKLQQNNFCSQLSQLSKATSVSADLISVKNEGNLSLVSMHYPADGQVNYAIVAKGGKWIPMNVNPTKFNATLAKKYAHEKILSTITSTPKYAVSATGDRHFSANMRMTKGCVACATLGNAKVIVHFDVNGKYIATQVEGK